MSITGDYWYQQVATQRTHELHAQADHDRLVRRVTAGRPSWWRRLSATRQRSLNSIQTAVGAGSGRSARLRQRHASS
ncbi:hypothetical protein JOE57_001113 [Microlunatus panaciterrae]|uniref:Uncharacterized protein n=1 Tax=Microlunatus panaciterrae TaxID=400768 RepID=A0ABS2RHZ4_9ACTN|nr:hypothetical protein [Microlunatus panaciterrae]MBM7798192.1 hypothetical protein [Microlunatus panaciterrae]